MKADWTAIDEWTDLRRARKQCLDLHCGMVDWQCQRDPNTCGTLRRLSAPRSMLVPSDEQIRARFELWALGAQALCAVLAFAALLWWLGGAW